MITSLRRQQMHEERKRAREIAQAELKKEREALEAEIEEKLELMKRIADAEKKVKTLEADLASVIARLNKQDKKCASCYSRAPTPKEEGYNVYFD